MEMVAVTMDGSHAADKALADLRSARDDAWLSEVSVLEHDEDGRYAVKAKNPSVGDTKAGKGAAIGGLTGLFIGALGGPLGLLLWAGVGAAAGAAIGSSGDSAFRPMVDDIKGVVMPGMSALVLVADTEAVDGFIAALHPAEYQVMRQQLNSEQTAELEKAAAAGEG